MILTNFELNPQPSWLNPTLDIEILLNQYSVDLFDQNGYNLTKVEQSYSKFNHINLLQTIPNAFHLFFIKQK